MIYEEIERLLDRGVERALTLWPEWQWPIVDLPGTDGRPGDKRVECRTWHPPRWLIGKTIALHWGAHIGGRKGLESRRFGCMSMLGMVRRAGWRRSASLGTWSLEAFRGDQKAVFDADRLTLGAIGCIVRITGVTSPSTPAEDDPYYDGEVGWRFELTERLEAPIPCKGERGLWPLNSLMGKDVGRPMAGKAWS